MLGDEHNKTGLHLCVFHHLTCCLSGVEVTNYINSNQIDCNQVIIVGI